ncbi:MAG: hypothetical protein ACRELF_14265 [Gemmataceae bacterium]
MRPIVMRCAKPKIIDTHGFEVDMIRVVVQGNRVKELVTRV